MGQYLLTNIWNLPTLLPWNSNGTTKYKRWEPSSGTYF